MNEILSFGVYLNELLTLRGIDKKSFASAININYSQLYRFLSSEQLPDRDQLSEICERLNLRASEYKKLQESYECTQYGWEIVHGRKLITDMLKRLDNCRDGLTYEYTLEKRWPQHKNTGIIPVRSKADVLHTVLSLLDSVRQNDDFEATSVTLILQPDMKDFISILTKILNETTTAKRALSVRHIIRFKDNLLKKNRLHNLRILDYLLPLSFFESVYGAYYSTEKFTTETYETFFPNFISIDSKTAFVFSEDCENGILYTSRCREIIALLNEEFNKVCADCLPLFFNLENYERQSLFMYEYEQMIKADTVLLSPENSFYTLPVDLIRKKASEQYLPKEEAQAIIKRVETFRERLKKNKALEIVSLKGLKNFAVTGRLLIHGDIQASKSERISILKELLDFVKEWPNYTLYLMKEENPFYHTDLAVYTIGSELLYIVPSVSGYKTTDNIIIRNRGIVESFTDFMHSGFTKQNSIIDRNEVASVIEGIVRNI